MVNRLICKRCNKNLACAAPVLGVEEVKRWHDVYHRLESFLAADTVVEVARRALIHLPDDRGDALRRALLELDQLSKPVDQAYLEYDFSDRNVKVGSGSGSV